MVEGCFVQEEHHKRGGTAKKCLGEVAKEPLLPEKVAVTGELIKKYLGNITVTKLYRWLPQAVPAV